MPKGQLSRAPWPELLDAVHFPACSLGTSEPQQKFTLSPASYHTTSLHMLYELFPDSSKYHVATSKHQNCAWKGH